MEAIAFIKSVPMNKIAAAHFVAVPEQPQFVDDSFIRLSVGM
jgi:hypothetical protein